MNFLKGVMTRLSLFLVVSILACTLSACVGSMSKESIKHELLSISEDKPYPTMDAFSFEGVPFGFTLTLSHNPSSARNLPNVINIDKTILSNMVPADSKNLGEIRTILEIIKNGSMSEISVIGSQNKVFSFKGRKTISGQDVTYSLETNPNFEMISFKKESRFSKEYLQKNSFDTRAFVTYLTNTYGVPDHTFAKSNSTGVHKDLWWGADGSHLIASKGYDFSNASHWKGFRGKTFFVSVHKFSTGEILTEQTMRDNFRAFHNEQLRMSTQNSTSLDKKESPNLLSGDS